MCVCVAVRECVRACVRWRGAEGGGGRAPPRRARADSTRTVRAVARKQKEEGREGRTEANAHCFVNLRAVVFVARVDARVL